MGATSRSIALKKAFENSDSLNRTALDGLLKHDSAIESLIFSYGNAYSILPILDNVVTKRGGYRNRMLNYYHITDAYSFLGYLAERGKFSHETLSRITDNFYGWVKTIATNELTSLCDENRQKKLYGFIHGIRSIDDDTANKASLPKQFGTQDEEPAEDREPSSAQMIEELDRYILDSDLDPCAKVILRNECDGKKKEDIIPKFEACWRKTRHTRFDNDKRKNANYDIIRYRGLRSLKKSFLS